LDDFERAGAADDAAEEALFGRAEHHERVVGGAARSGRNPAT
jgi:hypothetical protein